MAVFVFAGAAQEGRMIRVKSALRGLLVRHAFSHRARMNGLASLGQWKPDLDNIEKKAA